MEQIILIGCGGHAESVKDTILREGRYRIAGFIAKDLNGEDLNGKGSGMPGVIGTDSDLQAIYDSGIRNAFVTIGYMGKGDIRERIYSSLKQTGYRIPKIIDPSAVVAGNVCMDEGVYAGKRAVINTGSHIGKMCIINTGAVVEHNNYVGEFSHVAVGSVLCGDVRIGKRSLIGANATVIQGVSVGDSAIIGAGVIVRHDVGTGQVYYGR